MELANLPSALSCLPQDKDCSRAVCGQTLMGSTLNTSTDVDVSYVVQQTLSGRAYREPGRIKRMAKAGYPCRKAQDKI